MKKVLSGFMCLVMLMSAMFIASPAVLSAEGAYGEYAYSAVRHLNDTAPRSANSASEVTAANWILGQLVDMGYNDAYLQKFTYLTTRNSQNVIAIKQGESPKTVIVSAHYDCVTSGKGADDNASGVAVTLEAAKRLVDADVPYTIVFLLCGAEEAGLRGSAAYLASLTAEQKANILLNVNLDSLIAGDFMYIYGGNNGRKSGTTLNGKAVVRRWGYDQIAKLVDDLGLDIRSNPGIDRGLNASNRQIAFYPAPSTGIWSDHDTFDLAGIPYIYFEGGNWDNGPAYDGSNQTVNFGEIMHTSKDNVDWMNTNYPGRIMKHLSSFTLLLEQFLLNVYEPETKDWEDVNFNAMAALASVSPTVRLNGGNMVVNFGFPIQTYKSAPKAQNFKITDKNNKAVAVKSVDFNLEAGKVILGLDPNAVYTQPLKLSFVKYYNLIVKDGTTNYVNNFTATTAESSVGVSAIVEGYAANIPVTLKANNSGFNNASVFVGKDSEQFALTPIQPDGKAVIHLDKAPAAGTYDVSVISDGEFQVLAPITVLPSADIWNVTPYESNGKLALKFNQAITKAASFRVTVEGIGVVPCQISEDGMSIITAVDYASVEAGSGIVISGVKFAPLFSKFSFTFTATMPE